MTPLRAPALWALLVLIAGLCEAAPSATPLEPATDGALVRLHFFPLISALDQEGQTQIEAVWPFWQMQASHADASRLWALHPLFSRQIDATGNERLWDVLFPLAGGRSTPRPEAPGGVDRRSWAIPVYFHSDSRVGQIQRSRTVIFPLIYTGHSQEPGEDALREGRYFIFFPFVWDIAPGADFYFPLHSPNSQRSMAFWPFYGVFRGYFGADELKFALWPLWIGSNKGPNHTTTLLWPFFSRTTGPTVQAWRVWPLIGQKTRKDVGEQWSWLWPLGHHIRRKGIDGKPPLKFDAFLPFFFDATLGDARIQYYFPLYGAAERPKQKTTSWLWPVYMRTEHHDPEWTQTRFFWFLVNIMRGEAEETKTVVFPFFGQDQKPDLRKAFALYPLAFDRETTGTQGQLFNRQYVFPFWINERWTSPEGEPVKHRQALIPFYRRVERADGTSDFSWPHLWWYTEQPGIMRNWAPLWTLYRRTSDSQGVTERQVFWRLYRSRTVPQPGGVQIEREVNFLLGRWHKGLDGETDWTLLGLHF